MLGVALIGVAACQIVFGVLNVGIWHIGFFFIRAQFLAARNELAGPTVWVAPSELFRMGTWLDIHIAIYLASGCMLAAAGLRFIRLTRYQLCCFASVVLLYAICFAMDYIRVSEMMAREGLYATILLFSTYLAVAAIIPANISSPAAALVIALSMVALAVRLCFHGGTDFGVVAPAWVIGLLIGACLAVAGLIKTRIAAGAGLCGVAVLSLFVYWRFERDDRVYAIHDAIKLVSGDSMPYFLLDKKDEPLGMTIASIADSFTERPFWIWAFTDLPFPQASPAITRAGSIKLFVISSTLSDDAAVRDLLAPQFGSVKPLASMRFDRSGSASLWVHGFDVTSAAH
jgi:hypothetical protein